MQHEKIVRPHCFGSLPRNFLTAYLALCHRVGKFLREHHLDELPQLWNVFKGDMSFIGPRPERRFYIEQIMAKDARYEQLYALRPGVTSYATLYNGYADSIEKMLKRLELDLYYLQNRSWWMDTRILACTFFKIAGGKKF